MVLVFVRLCLHINIPAETSLASAKTFDATTPTLAAKVCECGRERNKIKRSENDKQKQISLSISIMALNVSIMTMLLLQTLLRQGKVQTFVHSKTKQTF